MGRRGAAGKTNSMLTHLNALPESAPRTKSGRIVWAWPQIQASLDSGRTMHEIWEALQLDGIEMSYGQFRTYVWRIRKRMPTTARAVESAPVSTSGTDVVGTPSARIPTSSPGNASVRDPLANIRQSEANRQVFDYRPELADPDKLI
jgi:hypothetical protein